MHKKYRYIFFIPLLVLLLLPLCPQSLRDSNKTYFEGQHWEQLNDLAVDPLPEPYTIDESVPIPYADTIDEGDIFPSLPQLGMLDYQNIPEDLLSFCDKVTHAITAQSVDSAFFSAKNAFLPYLGCFIFEHLPRFSYAFYGRPEYKADGNAVILLRLSVAASVQAAVTEQHNTVEQGAFGIHTAITTQSIENAEGTGNGGNIEKDANRTEKESESLFEVPPFFSDDDNPLFVMLEMQTVKEAGVWKIAYLDFKGAEYADSALTD